MSGSEPPNYTKYRARPGLFGRRKKDPEAELSALRDAPAGAPPQDPAQPGPTIYGRRQRPGLPRFGRRRGGGVPGTRSRRPLVKRILLGLLAFVIGWVVLSGVLFLVSAQIQQGKTADGTDAALDGGGLPVTSATNILVLGSDQRPKGSKEAGASTTGPSRSDSILLLRVGGGHNSRLSIARDTVVDIPGKGRSKINAAYAYGGAPLAITTIKQYLGIPVNHVIEVSFSDFPDLIDAMGGIDYKGGCVVAKVNGGYKNGGVTIRIRSGQNKHLNGKQALALARIRKNDCNKRESDLTRARRQQRIVAAMRSRVLSPSGFARLPWISWQTPRTFRTDMSGPTLMTVFGDLAVGGTPETHVLGTYSGVVSDAQKQRAVDAFMH